MKKINLAIVGYGDIGRFALCAALRAGDMQVKGVVKQEGQPEPGGVPVAEDIRELKGVDVAVLCLPSPLLPDAAESILKQGVATVDGYDEMAGLYKVRSRLKKAARENKTVAILAAGWEPGVDHAVRAYMMAMAPTGYTCTDFGPGVDLGDCAEAMQIPGVRDAVSLIFPLGAGLHRRTLYVELDPEGSEEAVRDAVMDRPRFQGAETSVVFLKNVCSLRDMGHGATVTRHGASAGASNQCLEWRVRANGPALTAQVLIGAARAALKQRSGCYTLPEIPPIDLLPGKKEDWIAHLW